jgi:hypothetical protein
MLLVTMPATMVFNIGCKSNPAAPPTPGVTGFYEAGVPITSHSKDVLRSYQGQCLLCHGQMGINPAPYPPAWDGAASGSIHFSETFEIDPGSKADHTGYTAATDCTQPGCHAAPR